MSSWLRQEFRTLQCGIKCVFNPADRFEVRYIILGKFPWRHACDVTEYPVKVTDRVKATPGGNFSHRQFLCGDPAACAMACSNRTVFRYLENVMPEILRKNLEK